jgi:hypothetical protein
LLFGDATVDRLKKAGFSALIAVYLLASEAGWPLTGIVWRFRIPAAGA